MVQYNKKRVTHILQLIVLQTISYLQGKIINTDLLLVCTVIKVT